MTSVVIDHAADWLQHSTEPAVVRMARRDLLDRQVSRRGAEVLDGPWVQALLSGQHPDGSFGNHPYRKWTGAHWRLVSLVELETPAGEPRALAALETVLRWIGLIRPAARDGRVYPHSSLEGNALAVACRLGRAGDERVPAIVEHLIEWQWPDGGWNCDVRGKGRRSSFHESLIPMWGLHEYATATGDRPARAAAERTAELLLDHKVFMGLRTGEPINKTWLSPRYPPYWHYDILQALLILSRMDRVTDSRAGRALDEIERQRQADGRWVTRGCWWKPPSSSITPEIVPWGRSGPNQMITLNCLRVLRAAGRWSAD